MPTLYLTTHIDAPVERVFDLSTSIDIHMLSTKKTNEKAIAGRMSGLIQLNETVTWRAKHLGVYQHLSVVITRYDRPTMFEDKMIKGIFKHMKHIHRFETADGITIMTDEFSYAAPLGQLGKLADRLFLEHYMKKFLLIRNMEIKRIAEGDDWKEFIK